MNPCWLHVALALNTISNVSNSSCFELSRILNSSAVFDVIITAFVPDDFTLRSFGNHNVYFKVVLNVFYFLIFGQ